MYLSIPNKESSVKKKKQIDDGIRQRFIVAIAEKPLRGAGMLPDDLMDLCLLVFPVCWRCRGRRDYAENSRNLQS